MVLGSGGGENWDREWIEGDEDIFFDAESDPSAPSDPKLLESSGKFDSSADLASEAGTSSRSSESKSLTRTNVKVVHEKRRDYKCSMCNYAAGEKSSLRHHVKAVHEHVRDQECEESDYKSSQKGTLVRHMILIREKIKDHECPWCGKKFARSSKVMDHINRRHEKGANTQKYSQFKRGHISETTCAICGFTSSKLSELADHFIVECGASEK